MPEDLGMASIPAGSSAGKSQPAAKPSRPARQSKAKAALPVMTAGIKGFDKNLQCRGFQFTVGETFKHDGEVIACRGGFHAITAHPLAVFDYYAPAGSRFCLVELGGTQHSDDQVKTAAEILKVGAEIGFADLTNAAVKWVLERATEGGEHTTGYQSAASATGDRSAASATGYQSAASATGDRSAASATGDQSAASATGDQSAASATGDRSAASATGDRSAASATGYQSAASATGYRSAASATGDRSAASATGYQSAASATGYQSAASATGDRRQRHGPPPAPRAARAAMACGWGGTVSGVDGCALFAVERDDRWNIVSVACGIVGKDGITAGISYRARVRQAGRGLEP
jgi:hypothetical protein